MTLFENPLMFCMTLNPFVEDSPWKKEKLWKERKIDRNTKLTYETIKNMLGQVLKKSKTRSNKVRKAKIFLASMNKRTLGGNLN